MAKKEFSTVKIDKKFVRQLKMSAIHNGLTLQQQLETIVQSYYAKKEQV